MTVDFTILTVFKKCRQKLANFFCSELQENWILSFNSLWLKVYVNDVK